MKKRSKKQPVNLTATATLAKQEAPAQTPVPAEAPLPEETEQAPVPETPEPAAPASESIEEASEEPVEASQGEVTSEEEEEVQAEISADDSVESFCAPGGKLCTCARANDGLPRIPTAIMVERHGERLRRHEERFKDLQAANAIILDKMLSLKDQIAVSYGLSLVLAVIVCILALTK